MSLPPEFCLKETGIPLLFLLTLFSRRGRERENEEGVADQGRLCPERKVWTLGWQGAEGGGWGGGWHFTSSSLGFASYRLGVTHAEKPWSQKKLERIGGNLSVYFRS